MESFENYRSYLFAIAYRMLGSAMDAEDMVQETYIRYSSIAPETIISPKAFLMTIITRLCMDQLQLARRKREQYIGPWLPEPIITDEAPELQHVEERVDMSESISLAFLVLLEQLQPMERAVFLLHEVFEYDYAEIAAFLGKSEPACRQSFRRAKQHLTQHKPRFTSTPEDHHHLLDSFLQAIEAGEMSPLMNLLAEDVTFWADGGGKVKGAATRPLTGRTAVARLLKNGANLFWHMIPPDARVESTTVNHCPALVVRNNDHVFGVLTIEVQGHLIGAIRIIANPDKLTHIH